MYHAMVIRDHLEATRLRVEYNWLRIMSSDGFYLIDVASPNFIEYRYGFTLSMGFLSLLILSEMADNAE